MWLKPCLIFQEGKGVVCCEIKIGIKIRTQYWEKTAVVGKTEKIEKRLLI